MGFDVPPPGFAGPYDALGRPIAPDPSTSSAAAAAASSTGAAEARSGPTTTAAAAKASRAMGLPAGLAADPTAQAAVIALNPSRAAALQSPEMLATRHARRIYVGSLPGGDRIDAAAVAAFFADCLSAIGGLASDVGSPILSVYHNPEKHYAFVEFRSALEASNAMGLFGATFDGQPIRVHRPNDYDRNAAALLGPTDPNPDLNYAAIGLVPSLRPSRKPRTESGGEGGGGVVGVGGGGVGGGGVGLPPPPPLPPNQNQQQQQQQQQPPGPERITVSGLPPYLTVEQARELLATYGELAHFTLVRDPITGESRGIGFAAFEDAGDTDDAVEALHGMRMGDCVISVARAKDVAAAVTKRHEEERAAAAAARAAAYASSAAGGSGGGGIGGALPPPPPLPPGGLPLPPPPPPPPPTKVLVLDHAVTEDDLRDDDEFADIVEDMRDECGKFGRVAEVLIPRPSGSTSGGVGGGGGGGGNGVGLVFVAFDSPQAAAAARAALHGRRFGGRAVEATFMDEGAFERRELPDKSR